MQIIPVIDLKGGIVVHAKRGDRTHYQSVQSVLTNSYALEGILAAFLTLYPFKTFYIADLDAITGQGSHRDVLQAVARQYPQLNFWLDDGRQLNNGVELAANIKPVIGTESQRLPPQFVAQEFILSLDFKGEEKLGLAEWFNQTDYWPQQIIVMNLALVGADCGCDFARLEKLQQKYPDKTIIAAGGIRNLADLKQLAQLGINHALVASALHSGAIGQHELAFL